MTAEEAIKELRNRVCLYRKNWLGDRYEMERYLEAYEVAIEALEKTIAKKPVRKNPLCYCKKTNGEELYVYDYYCPKCNVKLGLPKDHCTCGQAIDWREE